MGPVARRRLTSRLRAKARRARVRVGLLRRHLRAERDPNSSGPGAWLADKIIGPPFQYLFIVTYGRSGSTLLQGVLDSIPGYLIRGENRAMMDHLYRYHLTAKNEQKRLKRPERLQTTHPFYGIDGYRDADAFRAIRQLALDTILRPTSSTRVVGFKEIRWNQLGDELETFVRFLRRVFPGARFIVNTRNHEDVSKSKWWTKADDALATLERLDKQFLALADSLGERAYHVHYDDYVANPLVLRGLFDWLGEEFDEQRIRDILAQRHSY
jgi:hypothetical protein